MTATRFGLALPLAALVTFGLFTLMQQLVSMGRPAITEATEQETIEFTRVERDESIREDGRDLPQKPKPPETPPTPPKMEMNTSIKPSKSGMNVNMPNLGGVDLGNMQLGAVSDGEILPLVRINPQYPPRALSRGIEGWVQVMFTVTESGTVQDVEVVESSSSLFERAAIRAVEKWKYKPKMVNGKPTKRYGVQTVISFELAD